uniref:Leucine rich immune protein (Coil-less) n=1 Tax=Anopheles funestus TaxID=62324 RepID=A0A182RCQ2_ANOFN
MRLKQMRIPTFDLDVLYGKEALFVVELNFDYIERLHHSSNRTCCQNLAELDLSFNRWTEVDLSLINRLRALKKLRFSSNKIAELNGSLELPLLIELDLSSNRFQKIDLCHWNIQSLIDLNMANNQLDHMPNCIEKLKNLMTIRLPDNLLIELDFAPFAEIAILYLDFSRNRIKAVQNHHVLSQESCLVMQGNPISNSSYICIGKALN